MAHQRTNRTTISRRELLQLGAGALALPTVEALGAGTTRLNVRAAGHTVGQVTTAVGRVLPWRFSASREARAETVAIDFRGGTVEELMGGLKTLYRYYWLKEPAHDGGVLYQLCPLPSTLKLEADLRRLPFIKGIINLRREVLPELARLAQARKPEYANGPTVWARYFVSLFSAEQLEAVCEAGGAPVYPADLPPGQCEALLNCLVLTWKGGSIDERFTAALQAITPQSFARMRIALRARLLRPGGLIRLEIPDATAYPVVLTAAELTLPQRFDPYELLLKPASRPKPPASSGGPLELDVPREEWGEVISLIRDVSGKNVFSDCYLSRPRSQARYQAAHWEDFLDHLCRDRDRFWWQDERAVYIRTQGWYVAKLEEPSPALRMALEEDIRNGHIRPETLDGLSTLTRTQLTTLIRRLAWSKWAVDVDPLAEFLEVYSRCTPDERAALLADGLSLRQMAPVQLQTIRTLLPDSTLRYCAETMPDNFLLRAEQEANETVNPVLWTGAGLQLRIAYAENSFTDYQFVAPEKEAERSWGVEGV